MNQPATTRIAKACAHRGSTDVAETGPMHRNACIVEMEAMREALSLHEVGSAYAHRLAVMLECTLLDHMRSWDDAHALLDEYREACSGVHGMKTFMGGGGDSVSIASSGPAIEVGEVYAILHEGVYETVEVRAINSKGAGATVHYVPSDRGYYAGQLSIGQFRAAVKRAAKGQRQ